MTNPPDEMATWGRVDVYVPTGEVNTQPGKLARPVSSLEGARIAILDNGKEYSDHVLEAIAEALKRDHRVKEVTYWRKGYPAKGAPFLKELAASCDAAITGVGH